MRQAHLQTISRYLLLIRRVGKWQQDCRIAAHSQNFRLFHTRKYLFKSNDSVDDNSNLDLREHAKPNETRTLQNGLVHLKGALSPEEQIQLSEMVLKLGADKKRGFWSMDQKGRKVLNSTPHRGRMFDVVETFPAFILQCCHRGLLQAKEADQSIPIATPTHLILLYYKTLLESPRQGFIPWHQDNGDNDGDGLNAVVSFSLGDSCDLLVTNERPKLSRSNRISNPKNLAHRVKFESGDALVFGGSSRFIWHAIHNMHSDTSPPFLPLQEARLNLTFRHVPSILGDEERFSTVPADELPRDNQFFRVSKMS